jgi:hypothetical protein
MTCTLCAEAPATVEWCFPVCAPCAVFLGALDDDLAEMEAEDPVLNRLARKIDELR